MTDPSQNDRPLVVHGDRSHSTNAVCPECSDYLRILNDWWASPRDREGYPTGQPERVFVNFVGPRPTFTTSPSDTGLGASDVA